MQDEAVESLRADVRRILAANGFVEGADGLDDDANLFDAGMDSLTAVRLALTIEEHYDFLFPDEALTRETLGSISALARLVDSTRSGQPIQ